MKLKLKNSKILLLLILQAISISVIYAQTEIENKFPLSLFHSKNGIINIEHLNDGLNNGYQETYMQIHAPLWSRSEQLFAFQAKINNISIVDDQKLSAKIAIAWQMSLNANFNLVANIDGRFSQFSLNKSTEFIDAADFILLPRTDYSYGIGASMGILSQYFDLIAQYQQIFDKKTQIQAYESQSLNILLEANYKINDWEFRLPIQGDDLINFDENQLFAGLYVAYKKQYLYAQSNLQARILFELGLRPYKWLRLGLFYELNNFNQIPLKGIHGAYLWKTPKLVL